MKTPIDFAPTMRRLDKRRARITAALCGLAFLALLALSGTA